jgi:hypothetical protein
MLQGLDLGSLKELEKKKPKPMTLSNSKSTSHLRVTQRKITDKENMFGTS